MREYHKVFGLELPPLPRETVLSDFYTPTNEQHYRELGFIALSMIGNQRSSILSRELNYVTNITTFSLPYTYRLILQYLQPEPTDFVIPNQLHLLLY